jgi:hypothetical protein
MLSFNLAHVLEYIESLCRISLDGGLCHAPFSVIPNCCSTYCDVISFFSIMPLSYMGMNSHALLYKVFYKKNDKMDHDMQGECIYLTSPFVSGVSLSNLFEANRTNSNIPISNCINHSLRDADMHNISQGVA